MLKLQQGQVWKCGVVFVRIVHLKRLEVGYKSASNLQFSDGKHQITSKKDFCRMLKGATLLSPAVGKTLTAASAEAQNVSAGPAAADRPDVAGAPTVADDSAHPE
jgi:hypothetical protein